MTDSSCPFVSVVVPARDAESCLGPCLEGLSRQSYPKERYEVILVDDGSRDSTRELALRSGVSVLEGEGRGPAAARNLGVRHSRGELILFTDADCEPVEGWIEALVEAFEVAEVVAAKGTYLSRQTSWTARFVQAEYESRYRIMERRSSIDFLDTYSAAFRREAFLECGGFDESFELPSVEDQELGFRVLARGGLMRFVPEARVWHRHADRPSAYFRKKLKIARHKMRVLRRYPSKAVSDSHTPWALKLEIIFLGIVILACALAIVPGWSTLPVASLASLGFLAAAAPFALALLPKKMGLAARAPLFLALRALALGLGMCLGAVEAFFPGAGERRMEQEAAGPDADARETGETRSTDEVAPASLAR